MRHAGIAKFQMVNINDPPKMNLIFPNSDDSDTLPRVKTYNTKTPTYEK